MGCIEGDVCYVHFEVLVWIGFAYITVQHERFPLGREIGIGDEIGKRVAVPGGWGGNR